MGRNIIALVGIFVVIVLIIFIIEWMPSKFISEKVDSLVESLSVDAYEKALEELEKIGAHWEKNKFLISLDNSFDKIQDVEESILRLRFFLEKEKKTDALLETKLLDYHWLQLAK